MRPRSGEIIHIAVRCLHLAAMSTLVVQEVVSIKLLLILRRLSVQILNDRSPQLFPARVGGKHPGHGLPK
jgi:hypothetical protein